MMSETPEATLANRIRAAGIRIVREPNLPTAGTTLTPAGYVIYLGDTFAALPLEKLDVVLAHELAHIMRGDCLRHYDNMTLANIAQDAVINHTLDSAVVRELNGQTYVALRTQCGDETWPEHYVPTSQFIYEKLLEQAPASLPTLTRPVHRTVNDPTEARRLHAATILAARTAGLETPSLQQQTPPRLPPQPIPALTKVLRLIRARCSDSGPRVPVRSWSRPGRMPTLRGTSRRRLHRIAVALDRSGSMDFASDLVTAIATWCDGEYQADMWEFATSARRYGDSKNIGGGTCLTPLLRAIEPCRYDVLVLVTDAEIGDSWSPPDLPIIWCIKGSATPSTVRHRDRILRIE